MGYKIDELNNLTIDQLVKELEKKGKSCATRKQNLIDLLAALMHIEKQDKKKKREGKKRALDSDDNNNNINNINNNQQQQQQNGNGNIQFHHSHFNRVPSIQSQQFEFHQNDNRESPMKKIHREPPPFTQYYDMSFMGNTNFNPYLGNKQLPITPVGSSTAIVTHNNVCNGEITFEKLYQSIQIRDKYISELKQYILEFRDHVEVTLNTKEFENQKQSQKLLDLDKMTKEKDFIIIQLKKQIQHIQLSSIPTLMTHPMPTNATPTLQSQHSTPVISSQSPPPQQQQSTPPTVLVPPKSVSIIKQSDSFDIIEMKLISKYNYKPILDALIKKNNEKYSGNYGFRVMKEYCRFITLKFLKKDCSSSILVPPPSIDEFWKAHVMNTQAYEEFNTIMGIKLHYTDYLDEPEQDRPLKSQNTLLTYQKYFGDNPLSKDIWDYNNNPSTSTTNIKDEAFNDEVDDIVFEYLPKSPETSTNSTPKKPVTTTTAINTNTTSNNSNNIQSSTSTSPINTPLLEKTMMEEEPIFISLVNECGHATSFKIKKSTPFSKLMEKYQEIKGSKKRKLVYSYGGHILNQHQTPQDFGLQNYDTLSCKYKKRGKNDKISKSAKDENIVNTIN